MRLTMSFLIFVAVLAVLTESVSAQSLRLGKCENGDCCECATDLTLVGSFQYPSDCWIDGQYQQCVLTMAIFDVDWQCIACPLVDQNCNPVNLPGPSYLPVSRECTNPNVGPCLPAASPVWGSCGYGGVIY